MEQSPEEPQAEVDVNVAPAAGETNQTGDPQDTQAEGETNPPDETEAEEAAGEEVEEEAPSEDD